MLMISVIKELFPIVSIIWMLVEAMWVQASNNTASNTIKHNFLPQTKHIA